MRASEVTASFAFVLAACSASGGSSAESDTGVGEATSGASTTASEGSAGTTTSTTMLESSSAGETAVDSSETTSGESTGAEVDPCTVAGTPVFADGFEDGTGAWTIEGPAMLESDPAYVHCGGGSLRVDFRDPECGASSCNADGNNCYENFPQVVSTGYEFALRRFYMSWWVYYPDDFTFYQGPCLPIRGSGGHFVRFSRFHVPPDPNDSWYFGGSFPDFGQYRADEDHLGIRGEWHASVDDSGELQLGRNLVATPIPIASLAGRWNRYELFVDLGTPGMYDGAIAWSVNDEVVFDIHDDAIHVGTADSTWGPAADEAAEHPGLMTQSEERFTRLGLVSNPNSSFGGDPGDVYWIDDVLLTEECPADRPVCAR
jgi:hypothetical protein